MCENDCTVSSWLGWNFSCGIDGLIRTFYWLTCHENNLLKIFHLARFFIFFLSTSFYLVQGPTSIGSQNETCFIFFSIFWPCSTLGFTWFYLRHVLCFKCNINFPKVFIEAHLICTIASTVSVWIRKRTWNMPHFRFFLSCKYFSSLCAHSYTQTCALSDMNTQTNKWTKKTLQHIFTFKV